jgi:NADH dehydrogenase (ubiquinone) 1 alpha subcomplex subunit 5
LIFKHHFDIFLDIIEQTNMRLICTLLKESTNLTGLTVAKNPHLTLSVLYNKILKTLEPMPDSAFYKEETKSLVESRLQLVNTIRDPAELEVKLNSGQLEEVIKEAEYELSLARKMNQWKPWENLVAEAPKEQWKWPIH